MASLNPLGGKLGTRRAAHLLRRTTFGSSRKQIEEFAEKTSQEAVALLLSTQPIITKPIDHKTGLTWVDDFRTDENTEEVFLKRYLVSWWLDNARKDETILHKMILFLHQNWVTSYDVRDSEIYYDYLKLLEFYATGSYKTLAVKMTCNNSMLLYLNGAFNTAWTPNENYAREFLELFTIGKQSATQQDNYTEEDIKEAAKIFTGFRYVKSNEFKDADTGIRTCTQSITGHNLQNKIFSEAFQNSTITGRNTIEGMYDELEDFVSLVFNQIETARNICRKLYRFFVSAHIDNEIENDIILPLAQQLQTADYELKPVLKKLFESEHFYDADDAIPTDEIIGAKLKSPLELIFSAMRFFNILPPDAQTDTYGHYQSFYRETVQAFFLFTSGMKLFYPDNVAGYQPYYKEPDYDRMWINTSTIVTRYTLPRMFLENKRILTGGYFFAPIDILAWVDNPENISDPGDGVKLVNEIITYIFPENPYGTDRFNFFLNDLLLGSLSLTNWRMEWNNYKNTGNSASILPQLKSLFKGILSSQEFQLQ